MSYWILVVDDEPLSLTNAKNFLRTQDMRVSCLRSGAEMLEFIEKNTPDLILLDILMPDMDGFETYRALRKYEDRMGKSHIPVIFLTGEDNRETERRGLKAGASDYIHKPFDEDVLIRRIRNTIVNSKTIESLTEEAMLDRLTGFLNKASGTEKISEFCRKTSGTLMVLDLDNFKLVNDIYGHDMGDQVLMAFAAIVKSNVRDGDVTCRIGGDEFMTFFPEITDEDAVQSLSKRLNEELVSEADSLMGKDHGIPLGVSIGAARSSDKTNDYQILFQYADSALYEVKRAGKHGYKIYDQDIINGSREEDLDLELSNMIQIMSERGEGKGAMLLGQEAFSWNYHFVERFLIRYGGTAVRILFSLSSEESGMIFSEMVSEFGKVLRNTLRRTDMILQWQQNRYFVVLPLLAERDISKVIDRIMKAWNESGYPGRVNIKYVTSLLRKERYESKIQ
ncbi:MAG: diguanylate cyclase [Lachnospiraceae bacterium]|nr:diguanylate cyclase [Lachnospiraceae bacterium]